MTSKISIVTAPDDILTDGVRILTVNLNPDQTQIISLALSQMSITASMVFYVWKDGDPIDWFLDKKHKSSVIFFNAESNNELLTGYVSAHPRSHYFGILKSLHMANKNAIYNVDDCVDILTDEITNYER